MNSNKFILSSITLFIFGCHVLIANPVLKSVRIGTQEWSATNLDVSTFRNGDQIGEAKTSDEWMDAYKAGKPAWCYYNNDSAGHATYGKIYNWYAVNDSRGLAPIGYHIPHVLELASLSDFLGGDDTSGSKLKSKLDWESSDGVTSNTNISGFNALPAGQRSWSSKTNQFEFVFKEQGAFYWSSTLVDEKTAYYSALTFFSSAMLNGAKANYSMGASVRCVKDAK